MQLSKLLAPIIEQGRAMSAARRAERSAQLELDAAGGLLPLAEIIETHGLVDVSELASQCREKWCAQRRVTFGFQMPVFLTPAVSRLFDGEDATRAALATLHGRAETGNSFSGYVPACTPFPEVFAWVPGCPEQTRLTIAPVGSGLVAVISLATEDDPAAGWLTHGRELIRAGGLR